MRKLLVVLFLVLSSLSLQARDTTYRYMTLRGGAQVFTGRSDHRLGFSKMISPVGGVSFGRYFNKWLLMDATISAARFKGVYVRPAEGRHFATNEVFDLNTKAYYQKGYYVDCYLRVGARLKSFVPYVGVGTANGLGTSLGGTNFGFAPTLDYGLQFIHDFTPHFSMLLDFHGRGVGKQLEGEPCSKHKLHACYGLELGFVYNFIQVRKK